MNTSLRQCLSSEHTESPSRDRHAWLSSTAFHFTVHLRTFGEPQHSLTEQALERLWARFSSVCEARLGEGRGVPKPRPLLLGSPRLRKLRPARSLDASRARKRVSRARKQEEAKNTQRSGEGRGRAGQVGGGGETRSLM